MVRVYMMINAFLVVVPAALWVGSIQVEYPMRLIVIWIALVVDLFGILVYLWMKRWVEVRHPNFVAKHMKWFDFFPGEPAFLFPYFHGVAPFNLSTC